MGEHRTPTTSNTNNNKNTALQQTTTYKNRTKQNGPEQKRNKRMHENRELDEPVPCSVCAYKGHAFTFAYCVII